MNLEHFTHIISESLGVFSHAYSFSASEAEHPQSKDLIVLNMHFLTDQFLHRMLIDSSFVSHFAAL